MPAASGGLVVSVAGPGGTAIQGVSVFIDGKEVCADSTCKVEDLEAGSYIIKARAKGFAEMAGTAHVVTSGEQNAINLELVPETGDEEVQTASTNAPEPAPAPVEEGTFLDVDEEEDTATPVTPSPHVKPPSKKRPAATGTGKLNLNSIPVSNVIVDGRPVGTTPKMGLSLSTGSHTVVFIHPKHGRKVRSVKIKKGSVATAAVRFP